MPRTGPGFLRPRRAPVLSVLSILAGFLLTAASGDGFDHTDWDDLLRAHVREGRVDYPGLLNRRDRLDRYLARAGGAEPWGWPREEQLAFWINVYNARMVASVLDAWPVDGVLEIDRILGVIPTGGVFRARHRIAGIPRSLDDIEHRILRPRFRDARIHAAVNCASVSCPVLADRAYRGETIETQLDAAMRAFVNDPGRNRPFEDPPRLSSIFKWYAGDFEREQGSVWAYVRTWLSDADQERVPRAARPAFLSYDWALND